MNPVLVAIVLIGATLLWLICSFLYKPIGRLFGRLLQDAAEEILSEDESDETNNK